MDFFNRIVEQFIRANRKLKRWQRAVSLLSAVVVFVTTYAMVLPAITLDKDTAQQQPGIEVAASEANVEKSGTAVAEAEPEEEPAEEDSAEYEEIVDEQQSNGGLEEPENDGEDAEPAGGSGDVVSVDNGSVAEPGDIEDVNPDDNGDTEPAENNGVEPEDSGEGEILPDERFNEDNGHAGENSTTTDDAAVNGAAPDDAAVNGTTETLAGDILPKEILSAQDLEAAIAAGEIRLITGKTQLVYEYIDEEYEKYKEEHKAEIGNREENKDKEAGEYSDEEVDDGYFVYAEFDASAKLPEGVELQVREITKESDPEEYARYCEKTLAEMQDKYDENTGITFARFYDISFVYQGLEIEPSGDVKIRIEYKREIEVKRDEKVDAVHFDKENGERPEVIESEVNPDEKKKDRKEEQGEDEKSGSGDTEAEPMKAVEFISDSFSVYGVIGSGSITTTFLSADGNTYEVTIDCDTDANIPAGAELVVNEVEKAADADAYEAYIASAAEAMDVPADKIAYVKLLDISIVKDGEEVTPEIPVDVQIKLLDRESIEEKESLNVFHYETGKEKPVLVDGSEQNGVVSFEATGFSVYGVFYTVDFAWEVDGETYEFSLNGGGFFRLSELVEALRLADAGEQGDSAEQFVSDVANVEFSAPEFVWVGKIDEESTVAQIKEANELECLYSTGLSEEDIDEINAQTVEAGDWALISLQPFTSEETLTITMENGDQFVIKVTDAQKSDPNMLEEGEQYVLYIVYNGNYYTLNSNGDTVRVPNNNLDNLGSEYLWTYDFKPKAEDPSLATDGCSWANGSNYLDVYWAFEDRWDFGKYNPVAPASGGWTPIAKLEPANDGGFYFRDVNDDDRYLYYDAGNTHIRTCHVSAHQQTYGTVPPYPVSIHIYKQESTYTVSCKTDNAEYGNVRHTHGGNTQQTSAAAPSFNIVTVKNDSDNKQVPDSITAVPENGYKFTGWTVINESGNEYEVTDWGDGCTSESATIRPTVNGDLTLQANFAPERQYKIIVQTNNIEMGTVGGGDASGAVVSNQENFESISTAVINNVGLNTYEFTATKKPLHTFVKWELRKASGDLVSEYTTPAIDAKSIQLTEDNMTLTAVFRKKTETEIDNDDIDALLGDWQADLAGDFVGVDKTAHVTDFDNRIYEIDLSASSKKWATERSITLDFITDTSRSMYFPANLEYATGSEDTSTFRSLSQWLSGKEHSNVYYVISDDNSATMYAVYYDNGWKYKDSSYKYYEKPGDSGSSANTPRDVPDSLSVTGGKTLTGKIYKSSTPPTTYQGTSSAKYWSRLDYLYKAVAIAAETVYKVDPNSSISLTTFNAKSERRGTLGTTEEAVYSTLGGISPAGGTRQDRGLLTSYNGWNYNGTNATSNTATTAGRGDYAGSAFSQGSQNKQFAILVSDGAPNFGNSTTLGWSDIITQANLLKGIRDAKGENLTLMTLGLSLNFVNPTEQTNFNSLASDSQYAENANNGGEIVHAIKDLVQMMVKKADLYGTVSDTLDPAFYPVDENDDPITPGFYKDGEPYTPSAGDTSEYYEWSKDGEVWTITYYNQTFKWPEMDSAGNITKNGWEDSFYVKAKENFMGGNTIETNKTTDSDPGTTFTATHTIILDDNGTELPGSKREIKNKDNEPEPIVKNDIPTPHANVKQLTLDSNDTRWTVYTETNVYPPINQIQELFNTIKVQEVVDSSTDNMITGSTAMMFTPGSGTVPETFLLKDVINVTDEDWNDLMGLDGGDGTVDIPYTAYGHEPGVIRLTLTKEGEAADFTEHVTSSSPNAEEKYTLTAQYVPYTVADMQAKDSDHGNYHTTSGEEPGTVQQDGRKSVNTHIIDLFTRGISITKTDVTFTNGLPGAEFMVYRPATADEINSTDPDIIAKLKTFEGDSDTYFADHELDFDAHGVAYKNGVKAYGETTKYYLVETKAPDGYNLLEDPIPVELKITDSYTLMPVEEGATPTTQETKPASGLFNWEQKATLQLVGESGFIRTTAAYDPDDPSTDLTHTGINPTSLYEVMYYRIANTPGVELPYTGGPGTRLFMILGTILIAGAGMLLWKRRTV